MPVQSSDSSPAASRSRPNRELKPPRLLVLSVQRSSGRPPLRIENDCFLPNEKASSEASRPPAQHRDRHWTCEASWPNGSAGQWLSFVTLDQLLGETPEKDQVLVCAQRGQDRNELFLIGVEFTGTIGVDVQQESGSRALDTDLESLGDVCRQLSLRILDDDSARERVEHLRYRRRKSRSRRQVLIEV